MLILKTSKNCSKISTYNHYNFGIFLLEHTCGIKGRTDKWIFSFFLSGRQQSLVVEGVSSGLIYVLSGVTQGSVLCPALLFYYINNMPGGQSRTRIFANDDLSHCNNGCRYHITARGHKLADCENQWLIKINRHMLCHNN